MASFCAFLHCPFSSLCNSMWFTNDGLRGAILENGIHKFAQYFNSWSFYLTLLTRCTEDQKECYFLFSLTQHNSEPWENSTSICAWRLWRITINAISIRNMLLVWDILMLHLYNLWSWYRLRFIYRRCIVCKTARWRQFIANWSHRRFS